MARKSRTLKTVHANAPPQGADNLSRSSRNAETRRPEMLGRLSDMQVCIFVQSVRRSSSSAVFQRPLRAIKDSGLHPVGFRPRQRDGLVTSVYSGSLKAGSYWQQVGSRKSYSTATSFPESSHACRCSSLREEISNLRLSFTCFATH